MKSSIFSRCDFFLHLYFSPSTLLFLLHLFLCNNNTVSNLINAYAHMGLVATKPVFGASDEMRFKPACSARETSYKNEISLVASLDMVLSKMRITKALIRLQGCAGLSLPVLFVNPQRKVFSRQGPYKTK